jgi:hypothetical protein
MSKHPEPRMVYFSEDEDGKPILRVVAADATFQDLPLGLRQCLKIIADATAAAKTLTKKARTGNGL